MVSLSFKPTIAVVSGVLEIVIIPIGVIRVRIVLLTSVKVIEFYDGTHLFFATTNRVGSEDYGNTVNGSSDIEAIIALLVSGEWSESLAVEYSNIEMSQLFTKNDCIGSDVGSDVLYVVPAGTYTSTVSQLAADQLAADDILANGQTFANATGSCVSAPTVTLLFADAGTIDEIGTNLADWTIFFTGNLPTSVSFAGANVTLSGGSNMNIKNTAFSTLSIAGIVDTGCIVSIGNSAFEGCNWLTNVVLPICATLGTNVFLDTPSLVSVDLDLGSIPANDPNLLYLASNNVTIL